MYVRRSNSQGIFSLSDSLIYLDKGSGISFDTYFNTLAIRAWKQHTKVQDLSLFLSGRGRFLLRLGLHQQGPLHQWLSESEITLHGEEQRIDLESWPCLTDGLLYISLTAMEDNTVFSGGYYATKTPPEYKARLGIVITHYNRREYVLPAIQSLRRGVLEDPFLRGKVELIVVDNSQTLLAAETEGATLIPNHNLGCSGGTMRGLLHLEDSGRFTHCLFMDDDGACEPDSILRTYSFLSYSQTPKLAVAGGLLREIEPFRLTDVGGIFDGTCHGINPWLDARHVWALLKVEQQNAAPDFGGWWFFGFKLSDVSAYAFPFFVKGDDIAFSLHNHFDICTFNGVATWAPDFAYKAGPSTQYLDVRCHLALQLTSSSWTRAGICWWIYKRFINQLYSYLYASAASMSLALEHVSQGPRFWAENADMCNVFPQLASIPSDEKMAAHDRGHYPLQRFHRKRRAIYKLWRLLTLNGFLVPLWFFKKKWMLFQDKGFYGDTWAIFRYNKVYYEYQPLGLGFVAVHNKKRFFKELIIFLPRLFRFWLHFGKLRDEYRKAIPELTSRHFWEKKLSA